MKKIEISLVDGIREVEVLDSDVLFVEDLDLSDLDKITESCCAIVSDLLFEEIKDEYGIKEL